MAVYNRQDMVMRAIDSILGQDLGDFEFIIVDDGSTDATNEIIRACSDSRIRLATLPANCGISIARNLGLAMARGEFAAIMDSDDISLPARLARQCEWLRAHPDVDILGCQAVVVTPDGRVPRSHPVDDAIIKARLLWLDGSAMFDPTQMIRMDFLRRAKLAYPQIRFDMDHGLWIDAMVAGAKFASLAEELFEYHRHGGNLSGPQTSHFAANQLRKTPMRARLLGLFFPELSHAEANSLARWMEHGRKHAPEDAGFVARTLRKAATDTRSYWGESRTELGRILRYQFEKAMKALAHRGAQIS